MRNVVTNRLQGYQRIYYDIPSRKYEKKMLAGMQAKHAVFHIGNRQTDETWLVEGYATGLSVYHALRSCGLNASVVVCFSANNLLTVADQVQGKKFVFADNDASEVGKTTAEATGLPWAMADEVGWDANDLHAREGLWAVVGKIMEARQLTPVA
jgi:putative DNA primase/helicase